MRLKIFRAANVAAAMAQVRSELGADALILGTRRIAGGVEVTAGVEAADVGLEMPVAADPAQRESLRWHGVPEAIARSLGCGLLEQALKERLRFGALDLGAGAAPLLFAGPPGAGKTLTVARLATRLVLDGQMPLVISADAERAGAAEQLAAFTRLLGLTLIAAGDAMSLARALPRRQDGAAVLIDTGGIDPFSPAGHASVATLAAAAGSRTVLVLPAGLDSGEACDTAAAFKAAGATMLVATRLDVARRLGGILAAAETGLVLTEAGVGPGAADGLQPLTAKYLAGRLAAPKRRAA